MKRTGVIVLSVLFVAVLITVALIFPKMRDSYSENDTSEIESETEEVSFAPDFTVYDKDGNAVKLSDFRGKPTVVNFWATWCGYCVEELPHFNKLYEEYKDKVNFVMLDIEADEEGAQNSVLEFAENQGFTFPVYFDSEFSATEAYSVSGIPVTLLIDKDGNLYENHIGYIEEDMLRSNIESLLRTTE